ncbi:MAG: hypothetical protein U0S13_06765 [Mycobacterium sp.]
MNRKQRRLHARYSVSARRIRDLERLVESTGKAGVIYGLTHACLDCGAGAELVLLPGKKMVSHIWHDDGCPAAAGIVPWSPVPL